MKEEADSVQKSKLSEISKRCLFMSDVSAFAAMKMHQKPVLRKFGICIVKEEMFFEQFHETCKVFLKNRRDL